MKKFDYNDLGTCSELLYNYKKVRKKRKKNFQNQPIKILRILCQRPYYTGSGINLINLTKKSAEFGFEQYVIFGQPACKPNPIKEIIGEEHTDFTRFYDKDCPQKAAIPFFVAGMSDRMPYSSTKFSEFDNKMLEQYLSEFADKIKYAKEYFQPTIVHTHHLWLVTALSRALFKDVPVIATCHNTALRQTVLAAQLKPFVLPAIRALDAIAVINQDQQKRVQEIYQFEKKNSKQKIFFEIGQGINTNIFYPKSLKKNRKNSTRSSKSIMYVGKLNFSKGVPQLIQAFRELIQEGGKLKLYLAGSGKGKEKEDIIRLTKGLEQKIHFLGQISQKELAKYFRKMDLFVLPSFYEGFPKVLLESLACSCKAIITDLPGVRECLEANCGVSENVQFIPLPKMKSIDQPKEKEIPSFIQNLKTAIKEQLSIQKNEDILDYAEKVREQFGWEGLFEKYKMIYKEIL